MAAETTLAPPTCVSATRGVLAAVRCSPGEEPAVEARAEVARRAYEEAIGRALHADLRWAGPRVAVWRLDDRPLGEALAWGTAVGDRGGVWVHVAERAGHVRLTTSPVVAPTLRRAEGPRAEAFATRGLAAVLLSGRAAEVAWDRVPEWVFLDYVLGRQELLDGVEVLDEAAEIEVYAGRATVRSWWPRAERWAPGPPTTPRAVHDALRAQLAQLARLPGLRLALTAGRESALVAALLPPGAGSFTIGVPGHPDTEAAHLRARELDVAHRVVAVEPRRVSFDELVRWAAWQEGLQSPRAVAAGALRSAARDAIWLTGHGGELARAHYWRDGPPASLAEAVEALVRPAAGAACDLRPRAAAQLSRLAEIRGDPAGALDLLYAAGRMHKRLGRVLPYAQVAGLLPAYLSPPVVRALLDLPLEARRDGTLFGSRPPAAAARAGLRDRARQRVRGHGDWPLLRPLVAERPRPAAVDVLGDEWWASTLELAHRDERAQRWVWHVLATEALAEQCGRLTRALSSAR